MVVLLAKTQTEVRKQARSDHGCDEDGENLEVDISRGGVRKYKRRRKGSWSIIYNFVDMRMIDIII